MRNILLVDDDAGFNFLNSQILKKLRVINEYYVCENGKTALEYLKTTQENDGTIPDLILLDIQMPVMDGYEFLDQLKLGYPDIYNGIFIAILTSSVDPTNRLKMLKFKRVVDFVEKPLDPGKFFNVTRKIREFQKGMNQNHLGSHNLF